MDGFNSNTNNSLTSSNDKQSSSFILQSSLNNDDQPQPQLKPPLLISKIYEEQFFNHFHINYYGELEHEGLFLASIRSIPIKSKDEENKELVRILIRTDNNNYDLSEIINIKYEKYFLQILFDKAQLSTINHYESINHIKGNEKILEFDRWNDDQYSTKVALIYQRVNQITENEILSNNQMSIEMEKFLNLISDRIELKDFNQYRGDLDTKTNEHGIHSYFTKFENHQIMFNISPMIPSDQDFIQRKSLVGNALLCIVFQEKGTKSFQPNLMCGKVTQVYITIQPIEQNSELYYKIEIWRRYDIESIVNHHGGLWKCNQSFRNDFLTLILNTINIIFKKDFFQKRIIKQRQKSKYQSIKNLSQFFYSYSNHHLTILNTSSDEDITKQAASKHHRHSFIPKIFASLSSRRSSLTPQSISSSRVSFLHQLDDSDRTNDTMGPWIVNINKSTGLNEASSSINKHNEHPKENLPATNTGYIPNQSK